MLPAWFARAFFRVQSIAVGTQVTAGDVPGSIIVFDLAHR